MKSFSDCAYKPSQAATTFDEPHLAIGFLGKAALESVGRRRWSKRVHKIIAILETVFAYELLYIGGGNAKWIEPPIPPHVKIVPNIAGITGGVRLWDRRMDHAFTEQPPAFAEAQA